MLNLRSFVSQKDLAIVTGFIGFKVIAKVDIIRTYAIHSIGLVILVDGSDLPVRLPKILSTFFVKSINERSSFEA